MFLFGTFPKRIIIRQFAVTEACKHFQIIHSRLDPTLRIANNLLIPVVHEACFPLGEFFRANAKFSNAIAWRYS